MRFLHECRSFYKRALVYGGRTVVTEECSGCGRDRDGVRHLICHKTFCGITDEHSHGHKGTIYPNTTASSQEQAVILAT